MTDNAEMVEALKAVAHPLRLRILRALAQSKRSVGEIDDVAAIGPPALSQQLAVLRNSGLVTTRREAKLVFYRLDQSRIAALATLLADLAGDADALCLDAPRAPHGKPPSSVASFAPLG